MEAGKVGRENEEGAVDGRGDGRDSTVHSQPEREGAPILKESKFKVYLLLERLSNYSLPCLLGKFPVLIPHEDLVWNRQDEETIRTTSQHVGLDVATKIKTGSGARVIPMTVHLATCFDGLASSLMD
ncbi:uncharacterized protein [Miscanthus floridulus]|uniref:uncharacterized protein isoform X2 n=1 Tax=Miscanthus floridulus TaxID=154761 RepID=UPI00345764D6